MITQSLLSWCLISLEWTGKISENIFYSTEFNNSLPELLCSDDDSGNEDVLDMEYTEAEAESLKRNAEVPPIHITLTLRFKKQINKQKKKVKW